MTFDLFGQILLGLTVAGCVYQAVMIFTSGGESSTDSKKKDELAPAASPIPPAAIEVAWGDRLFKGLSKTRKEVWGKLDSLLTGRALDGTVIEEVEELLYLSDMGPETITKIMDELQAHAKKGEFSSVDFKNFLYNHLKQIFAPIQEKADASLFEYKPQSGLKVIMIVGVNGAGKTTTIGKLATKLTKQGANVFVGACDTFRAAAVDQLAVWTERAGATMVRAKEGNDPSGVAYDTLQAAINAKADYCLLDTAGRLHTATNLMEELRKNKRVLQKLDPEAPHQVLLVIDAITGQNALRQAEEFNQALNLTGLIFTKCDGSAKAGNAVSIVQKLGVPITYIGVGESVEDLNVFQTKEYLQALLDVSQVTH